MKVSDMKIGTKLYMSFSIVIALFGLLLGAIFFQMNTMKNLEDESAGRAVDAVHVTEIKMLVDETYSVIADSIINRNLEESAKQYAEISNKIKAGTDDITKMADTDEEHQWAKDIKEKFSAYIGIYDKEILPELKKGAGADMAVLRKADGEIDKARDAVDELLGKYSASLGAEMKEASEQFDKMYYQILIISAILVAIVVVIAFFFSFIITRYIKTHLNMVVDLTGKIAKGDLTGRVPLSQRDEFGMLADALNESMNNLNKMMGAVKTGATSLSQVVQQIASGNENLSQRTSEQASSLEEVASTIEEATATINQNADNSIKAKELTDSGAEKSDEGNKIATEAVQAINVINESSKKIAEIISVINDIAFQTNLLALNAAVEAARAGEQGRGFAVVAGEVRNLAQRSGNAAKEIEELIKDAVEKVEGGTGLVQKTGDVLGEISGASKMTANLISEIAAASREQKQGIEQINNAIVELDQMTQDNASLVEETASASEEMSNQADELLLTINEFEIDEQGVMKDAGAGTVYSQVKKDAAVRVEKKQVKKIGGGKPGKENVAEIMKEEGFEEF